MPATASNWISTATANGARSESNSSGSQCWCWTAGDLPRSPTGSASGSRWTEITGVGKLRVAVPSLDKAAKIIGFEAMLFSDDGSAYSLKRPE